MRRVALLFLLCLPSFLFAQVTIIVNQVPANTPVNDDIFIAGSFQSWNPGNPAYILSEDTNLDRHYIDLQTVSGAILFKFTRGNWDTVEGDINGGFIPDRSHTLNPGDTLFLEIEGWEDLGAGGNPSSTAADNVSILSSNFYMPQLDRFRRIWIYLPPDYETSGIDYPVLYMHDGQNVFDAVTSFAGEWEVDETLNDLHAMGDLGCIVVAVDNGGAFRLEEYTPWSNPTYGGGAGDLYVDFLVNTLKPHIDANYRTLTQREYTGIMGSSLGGLISLYAAIKYQDVFGKVGSLSPAYWINPEMNAYVTNTGKQADMRIYQLMGGQEGNAVITDMFNMQSDLFSAGFSNDEVLSVLQSDGEHSEWFWAREFEDAYLWLCANLTVDVEEPILPDLQVDLFPNPADKVLNISMDFQEPGRFSLRLFDPSGRLVFNDEITINSPGAFTHQVNLKSMNLSAGLYQFNISLEPSAGKGKEQQLSYPVLIK